MELNDVQLKIILSSGSMSWFACRALKHRIRCAEEFVMNDDPKRTLELFIKWMKSRGATLVKKEPKTVTVEVEKPHVHNANCAACLEMNSDAMRAGIEEGIKKHTHLKDCSNCQLVFDTGMAEGIVIGKSKHIHNIDCSLCYRLAREWADQHPVAQWQKPTVVEVERFITPWSVHMVWACLVIFAIISTFIIAVQYCDAWTGKAGNKPPMEVSTKNKGAIE